MYRKGFEMKYNELSWVYSMPSHPGKTSLQNIQECAQFIHGSYSLLEKKPDMIYVDTAHSGMALFHYILQVYPEIPVKPIVFRGETKMVEVDIL